MARRGSKKKSVTTAKKSPKPAVVKLEIPDEHFVTTQTETDVKGDEVIKEECISTSDNKPESSDTVADQKAEQPTTHAESTSPANTDTSNDEEDNKNDESERSSKKEEPSSVREIENSGEGTSSTTTSEKVDDVHVLKEHADVDKTLASLKKSEVDILNEDPKPTRPVSCSPPSPPKRAKPQPEKKSKAKTKTKPALPESHLITEFFEVRRSTRKPEKLIQQEKEKELHDLILRPEEPDLDVVVHPVKGRGIHAGRDFMRGDFVVEYRGELMDPKSAREREKQYAEESNTGCYSYYFECNGRQWCVDATRESPYLGRLVNHSSKKPNLQTKAVAVDGKPHLILVANRDIEQGEELLYNYGDRSKEAIAANPWLVET